MIREGEDGSKGCGVVEVDGEGGGGGGVGEKSRTMNVITKAF